MALHLLNAKVIRYRFDEQTIARLLQSKWWLKNPKELDGIDFSPVQRNKGIDAILTQQFQGSPILVKVQKKTETLSEAAELLHKAMRVKKSKKSFLIQTADYLDLLDKNIPTEIKIIPSPAFNIKNSIFS